MTFQTITKNDSENLKENIEDQNDVLIDPESFDKFLSNDDKDKVKQIKQYIQNIKQIQKKPNQEQKDKVLLMINNIEILKS